MPTQRQAHLMDRQRTELQRSHDSAFAWKTACSLYQNLPGLRGYWPMSGATAPIYVDGTRAFIPDTGSYWHTAHDLQYVGMNTTAALLIERFGYTGLVPWISVWGPTGGYLYLGGLTSAEGLKLPESVGGYLDLGGLTSAERKAVLAARPLDWLGAEGPAAVGEDEEEKTA